MDESNLRDFLMGDELAFAHLYNKYVDILLSYGTGLGFRRELIQDAIQDVFIKLYNNRENLRGVKNIKFYLFRSLKNRILDVLKADVTTCCIENYESHFFINVNIVDKLIEDEQRIEVQDKVEKMLYILSNRQREIIYLRFMHSMEYEEISKLLNITIHASRKLVYRAIKRIRDGNML